MHMSLSASGYFKLLLNSHHQRVMRVKRNVQQVYRLNEAWEFDVKNATIVILLNVFASLCRYVETVLDAAIVTHSLFGLQNHDSFSKDHFGRLVAGKILLVVANMEAVFMEEALVTPWKLPFPGNGR